MKDKKSLRFNIDKICLLGSVDVRSGQDVEEELGHVPDLLGDG